MKMIERGICGAVGVLGLGIGCVAAQTPVLSFEKNADGITCKLADSSLRLQVWSEGTVRVTGGPGDRLPTRASLAVTGQPARVAWKFEEQAEFVAVRTPALQVRVERATGAVSFRDSAGALLLSETGGSRTLTPAKIEGEDVVQSGQGFVRAADERFFGLGGWPAAALNAPEHEVVLEQKNTVTCVPVLCSSRGYGLFWDNPALTKVRFAKDMLTWWSEVADGTDYYFMAGPEMDAVMGEMRMLTGQAPLFPKWGYGFWFCKNRYMSQAEILAAAAEFRKRNIPLDLLVQDYFYWRPEPAARGDAENWGSHRFTAQRYPDPAGMISDLHDRYHVRFMAVVWAKFDMETEHGKQMEAMGGLFPAVGDWAGNLRYYDPFMPKARTLFWQQVRDTLFKLNLDGWWLDASEPEIDLTKYHGFPTAAGRGARVYNAFPLAHSATFYEGQRATTSEKRVVVLTRSAWAGQQRNAAATWSGDTTASWETLRDQIQVGLNFGLTGIPYWTTDIGGFAYQPGAADYPELFIRWFQWGAFCPIFRVHGGDRKHPWEMGAAVEAAVRKYTALRYRLMPYIYSIAGDITHKHYTLMRPLVMDHRADSRAVSIMDQFMFGPALLVSPVAVVGATNRSVYLPAGSGWVDFWTGQALAGGQAVTVPAPADTLPLHVRAGSIVPLGPCLQYADEKPADPIELRVYRGADGAFTLYEDEGDNYNYENGAFAAIPISWNEHKQTLTIGRRKGEFKGMPRERTFNIVWVAPGHGTAISATEEPDRVVRYDGRPVTIDAGAKRRP